MRPKYRSEVSEFTRTMVLPEEARAPLDRHRRWRWYRSPNVIDLWHYRAPEETERILGSFAERGIRWSS